MNKVVADEYHKPLTLTIPAPRISPSVPSANGSISSDAIGELCLVKKIRNIEFMSPLVAVQNLFNLSARLIVQLSFFRWL